jgi:hypothetical protein
VSVEQTDLAIAYIKQQIDDDLRSLELYVGFALVFGFGVFLQFDVWIFQAESCLFNLIAVRASFWKSGNC